MSVAHWPDVVNGLFELCGSVPILMSVRRLWRDRVVAGVHWGQFAFFGAWGYWNLAYYPMLGQWLSFYGGMAITAANTAWLASVLWIGVGAPWRGRTVIVTPAGRD